MASGLRAHGFVVRVAGMPSGVANFHVLDASKLHKA
jgi:hypothetical protein